MAVRSSLVIISCSFIYARVLAGLIDLSSSITALHLRSHVLHLYSTGWADAQNRPIGLLHMT